MDTLQRPEKTMDSRDPLHSLIGRTNREAWNFLESMRGHPDFKALVAALSLKKGPITEDDCAQELLRIRRQ